MIASDSAGVGTILGLGGTLFGLWSEPNGSSKCAIGHVRIGMTKVILCIFIKSYTCNVDCAISDERMRKKSK